MKFFRKLLPALILCLLVFLVFSFFHIDGREIWSLNKLNEEWDVTVTVHKENEPAVEYQLSGEQILQLRELLQSNQYTRRLSNTIYGALPDTDYSILADRNNDSKSMIYIRIIGGQYIRFSRTAGGSYHKIKNPEFEAALRAILNP